MKSLKDVNVALLITSTAIYISTYYFRGIRWRMMLIKVKKISIWKMTKYVIIGFMTNNILPARLGEFARALIISGKEKISARASFASVVLERVFDGVTIVGLLMVLVLQQPFPNWVRQMGMIATGIFFIGFVVLILLGHRGEHWINIIQGKFSGELIGSAAGFMSKFIEGLEILKDKGQIAAILFLSCFIWAVEVVNYFLVMKCFGIELTIGAAAFVLVVANLGIMIPSSPGNVGTMQYFIILGLSVYNVGKSMSLAYALVLHAAMYFSITIIGIIFLSKIGLTLHDIKVRGRDREELGETD